MNKYRNQKVKVGDMTFDSKKEFRRHRELKLLEIAGKISNLRGQVPYVLIEKSKYGRAIKYIADFVYEMDGKTIVEDVKSPATRTQVYKLKKRMMAERYGIVIQETELWKIKKSITG